MLKICSLCLSIGLLLAVVVGLIWSYQKRVWRDDTRLLIYTLGENPQIVSIDPLTHEGITVNLPTNLEIVSVDGRGNWLLAKLSQAGTPAWITESLVWHFGIAGLVSKNDLNFWDQGRLMALKNKINWKTIELKDSGLVESAKTADGFEVLRLTNRWYSQGSDWFGSSLIIKDRLSVLIVNTTTTTGLGTKAAVLVETLGMKVNMVSSNSDNLDKCRSIVAKKMQKSVAFLTIQRIFACEAAVDDNLDNQIRLELGRALAKKLFG